MGSCMVWLGIADGMKAEAFTCADAEAWLISRTPKLALHANMLFVLILCRGKTTNNHAFVCQRLVAYMPCYLGLNDGLCFSGIIWIDGFKHVPKHWPFPLNSDIHTICKDCRLSPATEDSKLAEALQCTHRV